MTDETITKTAEEIAAQRLLDQLGEFQAQADLLEIKRRELLDAVKVPDEVLAAQEEANKRRQAVDSLLWKSQKEDDEITRAELDAIVDPPMPPEFVAALEEARNRRYEITLRRDKEADERRQGAMIAKSQIDAELTQKVAGVYAQINRRKVEIETEFGDKSSAVKANIERLTIEAKAAAVKVGHTVRGHVYMAVYVPGKITWKTDMLEGMMALIPQIKEARKEGAPSITLRKA